MSHTNSTTNYNLPQFVGTDKPTWLNDINSAFAGIDTQMKANADSATTANTNATTAVNNTGNLTNLETTDKTSLVNAVNEINTNLGVVSGVASEASSKATQADTKATTLESKLNFTQFKTYNASEFTGTGFTSLGQDSFACASNADGSVGKIYGTITLNCNNSNGFTISFPTPLRPSSNIAINGVLWAERSSNGSTFSMITSTINIATDGTATITKGSSYYNNAIRLNFVACLLFLQDFGDQPE